MVTLQAAAEQQEMDALLLLHSVNCHGKCIWCCLQAAQQQELIGVVSRGPAMRQTAVGGYALQQ